MYGKPINLSAEVKETFYRIVQEALHNVIKHTDASLIELNLKYFKERISLSIKDNGGGFDQKNLSHDSLGMFIMKERSKLIGATLKIESKVGVGTKIHLNCKNKQKENIIG